MRGFALDPSWREHVPQPGLMPQAGFRTLARVEGRRHCRLHDFNLTLPFLSLGDSPQAPLNYMFQNSYVLFLFCRSSSRVIIPAVCETASSELV